MKLLTALLRQRTRDKSITNRGAFNGVTSIRAMHQERIWIIYRLEMGRRTEANIA
jgi:hypothetical protein